VAWSSNALLSGSENSILIRGVEGADVEQQVSYNQVTPGFFRTLGIELLAGRDFHDTDSPGGVAIVNRPFAERFGLDGNVVGAQVRFTTRRGENVEIIGLIADAKYGEVTGEIGPQLFQLPHIFRGPIVYVRSVRSPDELTNAVRAAVARVDPIVPVTDLRTMEQQVRESLVMERFVAGAATTSAVLATVLAGIGLYGVLAYSVAQQSRELALRVALGATAGRIRATVLRQVTAMAVAGVMAGVVLALLLRSAARSLLFGVEAGDPIALAGAAALLAIVMFGAAYPPARRASRVDPMIALRYQ
jgi:hypothetical protein